MKIMFFGFSGKLTEKSDVYSFGVFLLELLTGRKAMDNMSSDQYQSIVTWVSFIHTLNTSCKLLISSVRGDCKVKTFHDLQAMPQLTDRSKLPCILDPVIRDTMDLKHLYQVHRIEALIPAYFLVVANPKTNVNLLQVAAVAVLCVQPEPSYRPLITDVLHSLIPLVPTELGGSVRISESICSKN